MGDFFLDDMFPDHPKAAWVGDEACWLYVCGLAWAHRHNTGHIPKNQVRRLTGHEDNIGLAEKLATVAPGESNPLWYDRGDHYEIHDWYIRNAKSIERRENAQKAAKERWRRYREDATADANADAEPMRPHMRLHSEGICGTDATAMPNQPRNQGTKDPSASDPIASNKRADDQVAEGEEHDRLVIYWLTACLGQQPGRFRLKDLLEAKAALDHLRRYLDERVIEEQIGALANGKAKPRTANYLLKVCQSWGANNGVQVPPLTLATRQPPPDLEQHKEPA